MKVLVTGACGQLGRAMRQLSTEGFQLVCTDVAGDDVMYLDITDAASVDAFVSEYSIDAIVNCAGYTNVDGAEENQELCRKLNALAPGYLAEAMARRGGLMVHISTDYVFGGESHCTPIPETARPAPQSVYGQTKLDGETAVADSGAAYVILRTAWLYSPWGRNFVKTMLSLTSTRDSIKVVNDQFGTPTSALDLSGMIYTVLGRYDAGQLKQGLFHFTDEGSCSWYEFARAIAELAGNTRCTIAPCLTSEYPTKAMRPAYSVLDKTLVKETFGIDIPLWQDSLKRCLEAISKS